MILCNCYCDVFSLTSCSSRPAAEVRWTKSKLVSDVKIEVSNSKNILFILPNLLDEEFSLFVYEIFKKMLYS